MCGRYAVFASLKEICRQFNAALPDAAHVAGWSPLFNAGPMMTLPVIIRGQMGFARWGFVPSFAADDNNAAKMKNARSESVAEKPTFKDAWMKRRRCLIPANGFYEWKKAGPDSGPNKERPDSGQNKEVPDTGPYYIGPNYDVPHGTEDMVNANVLFCFAGLWEVWNDTVGFTILTRPARESLRHIHEREPVIFTPAQADEWFHSDYMHAMQMMETGVHPDLRFWRVGPEVGSIKNNDPALIKPDRTSSVLI